MSDVNTFQDERSIAAKTFQDNWTVPLDPGPGSEPRTKVKWPNKPWKEPKDESWVAWHLKTGESMVAGIAELMLARYGGLVIVQVFQKENTGTDEARQLADRVAEIYRFKELCIRDSGILRFRVPFVTEPPASNGWYQLNVNCPFIRDAYHQR